MATKHHQANGTTEYQAVTGATRLKGWSLGAAVTDVVIYDGTSTSDTPVAFCADRTFFFPGEGVVCNGGIFVDRTTTTAVIIYYD